MRLLLVALSLTILTAGATLAVMEDNGYVMIAYGHWSIEGSLAMFTLAILLTFIALYFLIRFFVRSFHVPRDMKQWNQGRCTRQARSSLTRGLMELSEGSWKGAEKHLLKHVGHSEMPLINYLGAARAAQLQGEDEKRDRYLQLAHESLPSADVAVGLTQAELQLAHHQFEQALATLSHLRSIAPKHVYVLKLLYRLYERLEEWDQLKKLLPELKRRKVLSAEDFSALEVRVYRNMMNVHASDATELTIYWNQLPRAKRLNMDLVLAYCKIQQSLGQNNQLEALISDVLSREWNDELVLIYGLLEVEKGSVQLSKAEAWLEQHPADSVLLLSLARICLRNRLWGKARSYYEASIGSRPSPEAYRELGELLLQLDEPEQAATCFQTGLSLTTDAKHLPLPSPETMPTKMQNEEAQVAPSTALVGSG